MEFCVWNFIILYHDIHYGPGLGKPGEDGPWSAVARLPQESTQKGTCVFNRAMVYKQSTELGHVESRHV